MSGYRLDRPNINGRPSRIWYVIWSENGRSYRVSTRQSDRREAERFLGQYVNALHSPPPAFDIAMLIAGYITERPQEAHHTVALVRHLGALSVDGLTRARIRMFHKARRAEGIADGTTRRQCAILSAALEWGRKERWPGLTHPPHIDMPNAAPPRRRVISGPEFAALYDATRSPHMRTFLALAMWTGQRAGAILELRWEDVRDGMVWYRQVASNKRRAVAVPMNIPLALALGTAALMADSEYIVSYHGKPIASVKKAFARSVARAGLEDVRIHDLRRTAASNAIKNGSSFAEVAVLLNDDERTVRKHYAHLQPGYLGETVQRIGAAAVAGDQAARKGKL